MERKQIKNLAIDLVVTFLAAYLAQIQAGSGPVDALWALLASALYGAARAVDPTYGRYGVGSS